LTGEPLLNVQNTVPQVFISHSSKDTWIAKQIAFHVRECGALSFVHESDVDHGDDFEEEILKAANLSSELLVLFTPWSKVRPYIWMEIGAFWGSGKRISFALHGLTSQEVSGEEGIPALLKSTNLLDLNNIDSYFAQLRERVQAWEL